jgi:formylglycine-generating enzyme required for sulfatase activity/serine/threonine protein kinase
MSEREIFLAVLDLPATARTEYLDKACGADASLRNRVDALLNSHEAAGSFLGTPAVAPHDPDSGTTRTLGSEGGAGTDEVPLGFLEPPTRPDSLGRIGHYEVLQVLGQGGFGIVFRAFDEVLHRVVAVKVLSPQMSATSPARKRFLREARSSAQVRHENVVQVYEVGEQPLPYIAMEFIPGETLQQRLDRIGPVDPAEVVRIGRQIAEGLAAAHATDLIHRDIKPGNVLLEGGAQRVKITDFGLARAADDASISQSGIIAGTPMYMAPEQAKGESLDQRADLFSLGSVLYQMAAGRSPFRANGTLAVLKRVAEDTPRPIREIIPETPQWLCDIIAKLHAKNPDDRYQSAREVADVLADCEAQLKTNAKLKDFSRIPRGESETGPRIERWKWIAAAVAAVLLLPVVIYTLLQTAGSEDTKLVMKPVGPALQPVAEGWVQLFNGKDLTGWKELPEQTGSWQVIDGILVGSNGPGHLYSARDDYQNFHLRAEVAVSWGNDQGSDADVYFRAKLQPPGPPGTSRSPAGYTAEIAFGPGGQAGAVSFRNPLTDAAAGQPSRMGVKPDEWYTLEVIAAGNHLVTKVNGATAVDFLDPLNAYQKGHVALQVWRPANVLKVRKIEIKELPATSGPLKPGDPEYTNSLGMNFKLIPAGKFTMGSSQEEIDRCLKQPGPYKANLPTEGPEHPVEITQPFYLGATEVTVGQFRQFVDEEAYQVGDGRWRNPGFDQTDQHPVVFVSWNNAVDFCKWLSKKEGKEYRLPTEAEWEYSCRAGKAGSRYGFGDGDAQLKDYAWFEENSGGGTHPVGKKKPNAWDLYDMHGNAWEWCQDNYDGDYYKNSPAKDPPGGAGGARAGRGGGWLHGPVLCRSAFRGYLAPDDHIGAGFRVLLVSPPVGVRIESGAKDKSPPPAIAPFTDADVKRIAALPAAQQVEEVRKELMRRNPGFDGKMEHKIDDGVVTEIRVVTDNVTDIAPLRVFNALRALDCSGTHTTDWRGNGQLADLTPLTGMNPARLTSLRLSWTRVGDAGLAPFKDCKALTNLTLDASQVGDAGLAHFKDCKNLTHLNLGLTQVGDTGLAYFKDCRDLTFLLLDRTRVTDAGLAHLKECGNLTFLSLYGAKVSDVGLAHLKDCKNLGKLILTYTQVSDAGLAYFKDCKDLTMLGIEHTKVNDLSPLRGMRLKELYFDFQPKRDADILRSIKTLEKINGKPAAEFWKEVEEKQAADQALLKRIADLPAAEQVEEVRKELMRRNPAFDGKMETKIEDGVVTEICVVTDISPIRVFNSLRVLDLGGTHTNYHGNGQLVDLSPLKGMNLTELTKLNLALTKVRDVGMVHFKDSTNLMWLGLGGTRVSDNGLAYFKNCKSLTSLGLYFIPASDAGLANFKDCKGLTHLGLAGRR